MKHASHLKVTPETSAVNGSGMDRKVTNTSKPLKKWFTVLFIAICVTVIAYSVVTKPSGKALTVDSNKIVISSVTTGVFEDFIPIRARVTPAKTVFLDAVEGGRVEKILVEDGTTLKAGDLIVELSNASLQLNVLGLSLIHI